MNRYVMGLCLVLLPTPSCLGNGSSPPGSLLFPGVRGYHYPRNCLLLISQFQGFQPVWVWKFKLKPSWDAELNQRELPPQPSVLPGRALLADPVTQGAFLPSFLGVAVPSCSSQGWRSYRLSSIWKLKCNPLNYWCKQSPLLPFATILDLQ